MQSHACERKKKKKKKPGFSRGTDFDLEAELYAASSLTEPPGKGYAAIWPAEVGGEVFPFSGNGPHKADAGMGPPPVPCLELAGGLTSSIGSGL